MRRPFSTIFFFNDTATTETYTLSLHDALPIYQHHHGQVIEQLERADHPLPRLLAVGTGRLPQGTTQPGPALPASGPDRKSTRLNSSHMSISYAVFCLKKKNNKQNHVAIPEQLL